jgi:structure-specific recognition protein 1
MLEKYIFFVSKQPVLVELSDISQVVFSRVGSAMGAAAARTFDLKIVTKSGPEYTFTSINKEEHVPTDAYLKDKKVRVKNEMVPDGDILLASADDSDEEMQSVASDDDEEPHVRRAGDDDDDDSEDGKASSLDPTRTLLIIGYLQTRTSRHPPPTLARRLSLTPTKREALLRLMPVAIES